MKQRADIFLPKWCIALAMVLAVPGISPSLAVPTSDRELDRAIAEEDDWLVYQQPGQRGCYLTPPAEDNSLPMQLIVRHDGVPVLLTPYDRGFRGYVVFKVDRRAPLFLSASLVRDPEALDLPREILRDMFAGRSVTVQARPIGSPAQEQEFSLVGFTAAMAWLKKAECEVKPPPEDSNDGRETR